MVTAYALMLLWGNQYIVETIFFSREDCAYAQGQYSRKSRCEETWAPAPPKKRSPSKGPR